MTFHSLYGPVGETHYEKTDEAWEKYKSGQKFYTKYQEDDEYYNNLYFYFFLVLKI
jgi:hypothetical protein